MHLIGCRMVSKIANLSPKIVYISRNLLFPDNAVLIPCASKMALIGHELSVAELPTSGLCIWTWSCNKKFVLVMFMVLISVLVLILIWSWHQSWSWLCLVFFLVVFLVLVWSVLSPSLGPSFYSAGFGLEWSQLTSLIMFCFS